MTADQDFSISSWQLALRVGVFLILVWALAQAAFSLITPRLEVSARTIDIARKKLLVPKWQEDFEALAARPIWKGQTLQALLTHVELAHYTVYELINWKMPPDIYRDYVLSPSIDGSDSDMNWRRPLWEFCYPRIRKENTTQAAAEIVARTLRERVTVWPGFSRPQGISAIWEDQITSQTGFERIVVATLRAVGVPARLSPEQQAQFWDGENWRRAPQPVLKTWKDLTATPTLDQSATAPCTDSK